MRHAKVAIVGGAGNVGSSIAYALMLRNLVAEVMLVDIDQRRVIGQVNDLSDALTFSRTSKIFCGSFAEAGKADIIIISAGVAQKLGEKRSQLIRENRSIISSIIKSMKPINEKAIIIVVTNPVDAITMLVQDIAQIPRNQIFGSGTFLDTQRLRSCIGLALSIGSQSVHAYVLGEHGESQFVAWSNADIAGVPLSSFSKLSRISCEEIALQTKERVYEIIEAKGATFFGVAACVSAYCENILFDQKRVLPLSCYIEKFNVCLSMPAVLGAGGIEQILEVPLNDQEQELLKKSAQRVQETYNI